MKSCKHCMKNRTILEITQWCSNDNYVIHKIKTYLSDIHQRLQQNPWLSVAIPRAAPTCEKKTPALQAAHAYHLYGWFILCSMISSPSFKVLAPMETMSATRTPSSTPWRYANSFNSLKDSCYSGAGTKMLEIPFPMLYPKHSIESMH